MNKKKMILRFLAMSFNTEFLNKDIDTFALVLSGDDECPDVNVFYPPEMDEYKKCYKSEKEVYINVYLKRPVGEMCERELLDTIYKEFAFLLALEDSSKEYECTITEKVATKMTITATSKEDAQKILQEMYENGETELLTENSDVRVEFECKEKFIPTVPFAN